MNPVEGEEKEEAGDEERDEEAQEAATREGEGRARWWLKRRRNAPDAVLFRFEKMRRRNEEEPDIKRNIELRRGL